MKHLRNWKSEFLSYFRDPPEPEYWTECPVDDVQNLHRIHQGEDQFIELGRIENGLGR